MAMNKKMHPRNTYKIAPNFKELALANEEFRQFAKLDIRGKVTIDFKDAGALRALTRALLLRDWELDVIIPPDKLVPTLPLRLNYILWIEDLLNWPDTCSQVHGIDIGTGSSCIYPLLAAKKNSWHMIGTEKDGECFACAKNNVLKNNLQSLISVIQVSGKNIFSDVFENSEWLENNSVLQFSLCNPPFFTSDEESGSLKNNRSQNRTPPHNARTGSPHEIAVTGGEVAFVLQMIEESITFQNKIRIFSTMLGHKSSVAAVLNALKERNVKEVTQTEFCQGRVTRWGIAWSFSFPLSQRPPQHTMCSTPKHKPPMRYEVPEIVRLEGENKLHAVLRRMKILLDHLQMQYKQVAEGVSSYGYQVTAYSNTWSNQRRRRREELHKNGVGVPQIAAVAQISTETSDKSETGPGGKRQFCHEPDAHSKDSQSSATSSSDPPLKKLKCDETPLLVMSVIVYEEHVEASVGQRVVIEMDSLQNTGNRELIHQIMQYFRNHLCK